MTRIHRVLLLGCAVTGLLAAPAHAAIVANGSFETGDLSGWQQQSSPAGSWEAYSGTSTPTFSNPMPAPPQGTFAATTEQFNPSQMFLYQDVTLPPAGTDIGLSLFAYYRAYANIISPDSLNAFPNEQYRIDVMRAGAPLDSVASGDILATIFRTRSGDPTSLDPKRLTADLSAFAGQTVRIRLAVVVTEDELNAGADAIMISGLNVGQARLNKHKGTAKLTATVTDPGTVSLTGKGVKRRSAPASKSVATQGGAVKLVVKPKGKTARKLNDTGKAKVKVTITYTPTGGVPLSETKKLKLKKT